MKIQRYKKASKTLTFYRNNFGFRRPYQVLVDSTFCHVALQNHINIKDQIPKYLQDDTMLVTSACIILEAEKLGSKAQGATQIVKQFLVHKCGHEQHPAAAITCIRSMTKKNRYIVASQDRELQEAMRRRPGQPIMYLHNKTPVLEQPSELSRKTVELKMNESFTFGSTDEKKLNQLKRSEGIEVRAVKEEAKPRKKKKQKNPNPLSCKKKKKNTQNATTSNAKSNLNRTESKTIEKKKRKRIRLAAHVKEALKSSATTSQN